MKSRTGRRGGGVAIYIDESVDYIARGDMGEYESENFEFVCLQLNLGNGRT